MAELEAIVPPENTKVAFEKLQIENRNLKIELEQCREELKTAMREKEMEVKRERTNTSTSQRLNEELYRKIDELKNPKIFTSVTESLNEEIFVIEKSKLEKQVSDKSQAIEKIDLDLKSAKEEITELKKQNSKGEVMDLEFKLGKSQDENQKLSEENKALFLENEDMRKDSREMRRLSEPAPGAKPPQISAKRNYSQEPSPILEKCSESDETGEQEKTLLDLEGELLASKAQIDELNSQVRFLRDSISQDAHHVEKISVLETELGKYQHVDQELEKVSKEYHGLLAINRDLRGKVNASTEVNDKLKRIQAELEKKNKELERESRRLENELFEETAKLRVSEFRMTESLQQPISLPEKDEELVQSYRNAPPSKYQPQEQNLQFYNPAPTAFPTRPQLIQNPRTLQDPLRSATEDPPTRFAQSNPLKEPCVTPLKDEDWNKTRLSDSVKVLIYWKKEIPTMEREVTYFDNRDENVNLIWDQKEEFYKGFATFRIGEHAGGIVFPSTGHMSEVEPFRVAVGEMAVGAIALKLAQTITVDNIA